MSITDELREWWVRKFPIMDKELHKDFTAIADRIDVEHESACAEAYGNGVMSVPIALDESAWVELPKDADGEHIHIGDKLIDEDDKPQKPAIVKCILYNDEGCVVSDIDPRGCWYDPSLLRHYHAPTVEDVLTEMFARAIERGELTNGAAQTIAEYAAKLRLAEEDA